MAFTRIKGGIAAVRGIAVFGKHCGIKKQKKDLAVIYSEKPATTAALYTTNRVKGAPLLVTQEHLRNQRAQAVVINSGVANVCTGQQGMKDARETARIAGRELGIPEEDVLIASTGLIGAYLPMDNIRKGLTGCKKNLGKHSSDAAEAILTTDNGKKEIAVKVGKCIIGAMAKGAGMIHPHMATMLAFIATDAEFPANQLQNMLRHSVDRSFNMLSVDHDMSTSDMAILMANGMAGRADPSAFQEALDYVCIELAKMIARDGEGATKLMIVHIKNAASQEDAKKLAQGIIGSNLVKTALFGQDPNWGRILAAMGCSGAAFHPSKVSIWLGDEKIVEQGKGKTFNSGKVKRILAADEVPITVDVGEGASSATAFGCDLNYNYVKLNAAYHT